jgi:hypothetical protein
MLKQLVFYFKLCTIYFEHKRPLSGDINKSGKNISVVVEICEHIKMRKNVHYI